MRATDAQSTATLANLPLKVLFKSVKKDPELAKKILKDPTLKERLGILDLVDIALMHKEIVEETTAIILTDPYLLSKLEGDLPKTISKTIYRLAKSHESTCLSILKISSLSQYLGGFLSKLAEMYGVKVALAIVKDPALRWRLETPALVNICLINEEITAILLTDPMSLLKFFSNPYSTHRLALSHENVCLNILKIETLPRCLNGHQLHNLIEKYGTDVEQQIRQDHVNAERLNAYQRLIPYFQKSQYIEPTTLNPADLKKTLIDACLDEKDLEQLAKIHLAICLSILGSRLSLQVSNQGLYKLTKKYGLPILERIIANDELNPRLRYYQDLKIQYKKKANKNPGQDDFEIGLLYQPYRVDPKMIALATYYFLQAAAKGHYFALAKVVYNYAVLKPDPLLALKIARIYADKANPHYNEDKAENWFRNSAELGNFEAAMQLVQYLPRRIKNIESSRSERKEVEPYSLADDSTVVVLLALMTRFISNPEQHIPSPEQHTLNPEQHKQLCHSLSKLFHDEFKHASLALFCLQHVTTPTPEDLFSLGHLTLVVENQSEEDQSKEESKANKISRISAALPFFIEGANQGSKDARIMSVKLLQELLNKTFSLTEEIFILILKSDASMNIVTAEQWRTICISKPEWLKNQTIANKIFNCMSQRDPIPLVRENSEFLKDAKSKDKTVYLRAISKNPEYLEVEARYEDQKEFRITFALANEGLFPTSGSTNPKWLNEIVLLCGGDSNWHLVASELLKLALAACDMKSSTANLRQWTIEYLLSKPGLSSQLTEYPQLPPSPTHSGQEPTPNLVEEIFSNATNASVTDATQTNASFTAEGTDSSSTVTASTNPAPISNPRFFQANETWAQEKLSRKRQKLQQQIILDEKLSRKRQKLNFSCETTAV